MRSPVAQLLVGVGAFALSAGLLVRFYSAPQLIKAPTDIYQVTRLRADNATYFDAGSVRTRIGATIVATNTVRGDKKASHGRLAVWESGTIVQDLDRKNIIDIQKQRLAFDRKTAQLVMCCGANVQGDASVKQSGIGLFWPIHLSKRTYQLFDTQTERTWPIGYTAVERRNGIRAYRFDQHIPATKVTVPTPDVPGELLGRAKGAVPVDRYYQADATYWVDPRTGAVVDEDERVLTTLRARSGPGTLVVANMHLRMTPESRAALYKKSKDGATELWLLTVLGPWTSGGIGLVLLAIGLPFAVRRPRRRPRHGADQAGVTEPVPSGDSG